MASVAKQARRWLQLYLVCYVELCLVKDEAADDAKADEERLELYSICQVRMRL